MVTYALVALMMSTPNTHAFVIDYDMSFTDCLSEAIQLNSRINANGDLREIVLVCEPNEIPLILADPSPIKIYPISK